MIQFHEELARRFVSQTDQLCRAALDRVSPGWTIDEIAARCEWHIIGEVSTLRVDGEPVLELHKPTFATEQSATGYTLRASQNYRWLGRATPPQTEVQK
jgi:hypothetical protein